MVFKLVSLDAAEPCKVKLLPGKHIFGRDKSLFQHEYDNRVSRNHAEIAVTADEVILTALHINPCFYLKRGQEETDIVFQNTKVSLYCGDKFGLLPDKYWYELIFCADVPDDESCLNDKEEETEETKPEVEDKKDSTEHENGLVSPFMPPPDSPTQQYDWDAFYSNMGEENDNTKTATKRPLTPDKPNDDAKKAKNAAEDDMDQAGPSNEREADNKLVVANNANPGAAGQDANAPVVRERCMYGAQCYRRNPAHKAQYSHPADADWAAGGAGACAWGARCRRRDPRHRRDYVHPPSLHQPRDDLGKKKKVKSDDSPTSGLIVTGKRARKTVRNYSWSGSESDNERDPYATDESDEWQPSSDLTDTQDYSQN